MRNLFKINYLWNTIKVVVLLVLSTFSSLACDVCGCAVGGMSMGLGLDAHSNFIGLRYSHVTFNASIDYNSQYLEDVYSNDVYNRYELVSKYHFTPRVYTTAILPYVQNSMVGNTESVQLNSLGDIGVNAFYRLIQASMDTTARFNHLLDFGMGVSLPTGKYDLAHEGDLVNRNFQAGTGAVNYRLSLNYILTYNNWRVGLENNYQLNTKNKHAYKFGNQYNSVLYLGKLFRFKDITVFPTVGLYYERGKQHLNDDKLVFNTGGEALLADLGVQFKWKRYMVWGKYLPVLYQNYTTDHLSDISGGNRLNVGMRVLF